MENSGLSYDKEVSFNIILRDSKNGNTSDYENEQNPRQWVHMDSRISEKTILVLAYFKGNEKGKEFEIKKISFLVVRVNASENDPTTQFLKIIRSTFDYDPDYQKTYSNTGGKDGVDSVTMKQFKFSFDPNQSGSKKEDFVETFDLKELSPVDVKNGEVVDFHIKPISEVVDKNDAKVLMMNINGHICQGKFYIHYLNGV